MRALVGTLFAFENELDACVDAIERQKDVALEHFVIRGRPNREAHAELYRTFMQRAGDFDLFVKVDADMVIDDEGLIACVAGRFRDDPTVDQAEIRVFDWFSDQLVPGMNFFRSSVRWPERPDGLYVDETPVPAERRVKHWRELEPAARHCPDPSPFQSFHFGLHKGLKAVEALAARHSARLERHWTNVELTWRHFERCPDARLGLASLGAELALRGDLAPAQIDAGDPVARALFEAHAGASSDELRLRVSKLRRELRRGLPSSFWLAWWTRRRHPLRPLARRLLSAARGQR
jgi:hypothetical protein